MDAMSVQNSRAIAFVRIGSFSHINDSLRAELARQLPGYDIDDIDVASLVSKAERWGWRNLSRLVADQRWPDYDPALVADDVLPYAVQINGKLRSEIRIAADSGETEVRAAAEADDKVRQSLAGKSVKKVVFVPKRLINFVV